MNRNSYRSGAAAKILGLSQYGIRRLWAAGLIRAEETSAGQLLFPESEIARLQKEGVPPVPAPTEAERLAAAASAAGRTRSRCLPPEHPVRDRVQDSEDEVAIIQNTVLQRKAQLELAEADSQLTTRLAREDRLNAEREEAERLRREEADGLRRHAQWKRDMLEGLSGALSHRWPLEVLNQMLDAAGTVLDRYDPDVEAAVLLKHLTAATDAVLAPWRRREEVEEIVSAAVRELHYRARGLLKPSDWDLKAIQAAWKAVRMLGDDVSLDEIKLAARQAVQGISSKFLHDELCREIVRTFALPGATWEDRADGRDLVRRALAVASVGSSARELRLLAEAALEPIRDRISLRQDQALRQEVMSYAALANTFIEPKTLYAQTMEAVRIAVEQAPAGSSRKILEGICDQAAAPFRATHAQNRKKQELIGSALSEVATYLYGKVDRPSSVYMASFRIQQLNPLVKARLEEELNGDESPNAAKRRARELTIELDAAHRE